MPSRRGYACVVALWLAACQSAPWAWAHCPAPLAPVASLGPDRSLRATVRVERGERVAHLDLRIEKHEDELVLVARNELGSIAFAVVQRGGAAEVERSLPASLLPLPPKALLSDVQRVFFGTAPAPGDGRISRCGYTAHFALVEEASH
jgi:hypothetical protein